MMKIPTLIGLLAAAFFALPVSGQAATLLSIDLSVANQITVTAEAGLADTSISGSDTTGIYFPNFFDTPGGFFNIGGASGDFTTANQTSDGSPILWRASGDTGLNIYSFAIGPTASFTAGSQAFSGSSTWSLTPGRYAEFVNAPGAGAIFFPADTADDIVGQTPIGAYATSNVAPIPLPAPVTLLGAALMALAFVGRRRKAQPGLPAAA